MKVSTYKANGMFAKELEDELMKFTMKSEDIGVQGHMVKKKTDEVQMNNSDVEVNITECTKSTDNRPIAPQYLDLTESGGSSSFDGSDSDFEDVDILADSEALSDTCGDAASALDFDGFGDNFRRKKLTAHWRSFIQPIMWRCKWTELQIKKLQSLAQQYDKELKSHNNQKQIHVEGSTLIDGVKSAPFSRTNAGNDLVNRKKRRMTEATTDIAAYMSCHNLFSYYENKKNSIEGVSMNNLSKVSATQKANIDDEFLANDDISSFIAGDGDNSLEDILRKIELLQSQADQLRSRVDSVISENAEKIFSVDNANNGDGMDVGTYIASQLISDYNMGDILVHKSEVTNRGDGDPDANANVDHARFADAYRTVEDGALVDYRKVKEETHNFEEVIINPTQKPLVQKDVSINTIPPVADEPNLHTDDQPSSQVRSVAKITAPRSKRKRGRKKGPRRRTRSSTG